MAKDKRQALRDNTKRAGLVQWRPPPIGAYKINWDAALDSKAERIGIGIIVRDSKGKIIIIILEKKKKREREYFYKLFKNFFKNVAWSLECYFPWK
jgi:hypothetical protein